MATDDNRIVTTNPDPTLNVREGLAAEKARNDDLRTAESRRVDGALESMQHFFKEGLLAMRREMEQRTTADKEVRLAESSRIDAIRAVDVGNVSVAAERQSAAAGVLATQVTASAEALRTQFVTATGQLSDRITLLERSSYEGVGKSIVADPAAARLADKMEALITAMSEGKGRAGLSTPIIATLCGIGGAAALFVLEHGVK